MTLTAEFTHQHFAHCESGVMSALLRTQGVHLSEPMVFGLSGALCFAYLPFLKFGNMPLVSYRMFPGHIVKTLPKRLHVPWERRTYRDQDLAMAELDERLAAGIPVGLQVSAYFTTYFPPEMRFHFNAHNIIIVGKEGEEYLVSDPVFDQIKRIHRDDLSKARFARGLSAPKGMMHAPLSGNAGVDIAPLIPKAIRKTLHMMLHAPLPWIGIRGIHKLARDVAKLSRKDPRYARLFLGNVVRMQEEIGTGGGGFRFMYASFLQEAFDITNLAVLKEASAQMTEAGDLWRQFASASAHIVKSKDSASRPEEIARLLAECGEKEKEIYRMLNRGLRTS